MQNNNDTFEPLNHLLSLAKSPFTKRAPIFIGFLIFFAYFIKIKYFPPIELFSLASLLISAFIIGSLTLACIALSFWFPGWAWMDSTFSDKKYHKALAIRKISQEKNSTLDYRTGAILTHLCAPITLTITLQCISAIYLKDTWHYALAFFIIAFSIAILSSYILKKRSNMHFSFFIEQCFTSSLILIFSSLLWLIVSISLLQTRNFTALQSIITSSIGTIFCISISSLFSLLERRIATICRIILIAIVLAVTGAHNFLPGKIISILGIGNYFAHLIYLHPDHCDYFISENTGNENCLISRPLILWGQGDIWKVGVSLEHYVPNRNETCTTENGCMRTMLLPKESISSVIQ